MEEKSHHLLQPLISSATSLGSSAIQLEDDNNIDNHETQLVSSNSEIIFRFGLIICIGIISIWANHEASKGHSITIVNEADDTAAGRRFALFYASNDKASRLVYDTSKFVENFLYPTASYPKKQVNHVILRLSSQYMMQTVAVDSHRNEEFVLSISPSVMGGNNFSHAMFLAVQEGMVRIWLGDGEGEARSSLVDRIVEYLTHLAAGNIESPENMEAQPDCWRSKNPEDVAQFLNYYELRKPGFVRRLNQELRYGWNDRTVDEALGMPIQHLCAPHNSSNHLISI